MDEDDIDLRSLIKKYENMRVQGKKIYFDADEFALLAYYYQTEGDVKEANLLIDEGLEIHPGSSELMALKAKQLINARKYEEGYSFMLYLSDDDDLEIPLLKVEALLHLSRFDEAEELAKKIISKDLSEEDHYYFINEVGYLLNDVRKYDRAIAYLEEGMKINSSNNEAIEELAYAYEMKKDFDKAIELYNKFLDINPYSYDTWINIGNLYTKNDEYNKAIDSFDFALTINEDDILALQMKAEALMLNDNLEEAAAVLQKCIKLTPHDDGAYDSLLKTYASMEMYDEMMNVIDLWEEQFGSRGVIVRRAFVFFIKGDLESAKSYFSQIPEDEKDSVEYYMLEGELEFYDDNFAAAEAAYIKAALSSDENVDVLDKLANVSVAQEKYVQAAEYLQELIDISPEYPSAKARLAFIRFEIGSKEPFDEIMNKLSDDELIDLLSRILLIDKSNFKNYSREKTITRLNEARENRVLFKNIKY